jgi:malonate transporter and related proteins
VRSVVLLKQVVLNPIVLETMTGLAWTITGLPVPAPIAAHMSVLAAALMMLGSRSKHAIPE